MKKYIALIFAFLFVSSIVFAETTDEFLQKYFNHTGIQKFDSVKTLEVEGSTTVSNMFIPFRLDYMKPNFYRMKERNGDVVAYKIDNGTEKSIILRDTTIDFPVFDNFIMRSIIDLLQGCILNYEKNGFTIDYQGTDTLRGNTFFKLVLTDQIDQKYTALLDTTTYDIRYLSGNPLSGPMQFSPIFLDNYQKVDGISFPFKIDYADRGMEIIMRIDQIKLNVNLPKSIFTVKSPENKNFD
ncbi:MAG: hypothetical protein ABFD00_06035 [Chloroherpetonaceae bacterium]|nr:hypothetical protein [bacterium]